MKRIATLTIIVTTIALPVLSNTNQSKTTASANDTIAVVLGKTISVKDKDRLQGLIFGALLEQYAKENNIEPTQDELDVFGQKMEEQQKRQQVKYKEDREKLIKELQSPSLSERERKDKTTYLQTIENILKITKELEEKNTLSQEQKRAIRQTGDRYWIKSWKINKSLYQKYGGRIIFQQAGPEPLDAYREFLKEQEKKKAFQIFGKEHEDSFWKYFINDAMHTFYPKKDGAKLMNTPWWLLDKPEGK